MRQLSKYLVVGLMALSGVVASAQAPTFPVKGRTITIINPYPPGGLGDVLARALAHQIGMSLGTTVIVDNKAGANGAIGTTFVARAQPDGYTLGSVPMSTLAINPLLYKGLGYDPATLTPITQAVTFANVLVAPASLPVKSLADLPRFLKENASSVNFASQGNGSSGHLEGELLSQSVGAKLTHVPYKGSGPALQDLLSDKVQLLFETVPAAAPFIKSGQLRALGVASPTPQPLLPDVPTISSVIKGFEAVNWIGVIAPPNLPPQIRDTLNQHIVRALQSDELKSLAADRGVTLVGSTPEQLRQVIDADTRKWSEVVRQAGVKID